MTRRATKPTPSALLTDGWMSARDVARELGIHRSTVASYALRGALTYQIAAGRTVYSRESVEKLGNELNKKSA